MKKILVTGATGYIGNYVIAELLLHDFYVIATSSSEVKARQKSWFKSVNYVEFDLRKFNEDVNYFNFFHKPDALIHLTWEGLPNYKSDYHVTENFPRHLRFLTNMIEHGLKNITVTGTCFEYGMQEGQLSESMGTKPANCYALAKDKLRKEMEIICKQTFATLKWVRLFYMYGEGQHPNSLISQLEKAVEENKQVFNMSGGEQERDFLPVDKVAAYIVRIAIQNRVQGVINCCSGEPVKVKDLVINYLKQKNKNIQLNLGYYPYTDYEPMRFWGDNSKLKSILKHEQSN